MLPSTANMAATIVTHCVAYFNFREKPATATSLTDQGCGGAEESAHP